MNVYAQGDGMLYHVQPSESSPHDYMVVAVDNQNVHVSMNMGSGSGDDIISSSQLTLNTWTELKVVKQGPAYELFFDGESVGTGNTQGSSGQLQTDEWSYVGKDIVHRTGWVPSGTEHEEVGPFTGCIRGLTIDGTAQISAEDDGLQQCPFTPNSN
jgi:hypothetical protein